MYHYKNVRRLSKREAKLILTHMQQILEWYGTVTLADYYDLIGCKYVKYTDNNLGWISLSKAKIKRVFPYGFKIDLPKPIPLE